MDGRDGFYFHRSFRDAIDQLPQRDQLALYRAITKFGLDGIEPEKLTPTQNAFYLLVRPVLAKGRTKAANGKQGGSRRKQTGSKPEANRKQTGSKMKATMKVLPVCYYQIIIQIPNQTRDKGVILRITIKDKGVILRITIKDKGVILRITIKDAGSNPSDYDKGQGSNPSDYDKGRRESAPAQGSSREFTEFWKEYPAGKGGDRDAAWNAWEELNPSTATAWRIMDALRDWKDSAQWAEDGGRYIPGAAKFLREQRWMAPPDSGFGYSDDDPTEATRKTVMEAFPNRPDLWERVGVL